MSERFFVVNASDNSLMILDKLDGVVEEYSVDDIKRILKSGIRICGVEISDTNPIFTFNGLNVNIYYPKHKKFGKFYVVYLNKGDRIGSSLSSVVKEPSIMFYDSTASNFDRHMYPFGQPLYSYYVRSILDSKGGLIIDNDVPSWNVDAETMDKIRSWINSVK